MTAPTTEMDTNLLLSEKKAQFLYLNYYKDQ